MSDLILLREDRDHIATLTLNSPSNYNALSDAMLLALSIEISKLAKQRHIRVVVLRATGKAFCAGHDLKEMQAARGAPDAGRAYFKSLFDTCGAVMQSLQALPQPVIAEVQGIATAAGCQLVATCDLVVAATSARFGVNGVNIGLFCSTPMVALTRKIPASAAFELLMTGEFIDAPRAQALGLVNQVVAADALTAQTRKLAETISAKLAKATRLGKAAFYPQLSMTTADAYAFTGAVMVDNMLNPDTDEGINAFLAKRKPNWRPD